MLPATAAAASSATSAPAERAVRVLAGVRFHTVTAWPARSSAVATAVPIAPVPRTVTGLRVFSLMLRR